LFRPNLVLLWLRHILKIPISTAVAIGAWFVLESIEMEWWIYWKSHVRFCRVAVRVTYLSTFPLSTRISDQFLGFILNLIGYFQSRLTLNCKEIAYSTWYSEHLWKMIYNLCCTAKVPEMLTKFETWFAEYCCSYVCVSCDSYSNIGIQCVHSVKEFCCCYE
jgi:hypothetical protein